MSHIAQDRKNTFDRFADEHGFMNEYDLEEAHLEAHSEEETLSYATSTVQTKNSGPFKLSVSSRQHTELRR